MLALILGRVLAASIEPSAVADGEEGILEVIAEFYSLLQ